MTTSFLEKKGTKILLTGGSGFVAQNIIILLNKLNFSGTIYNLGRTSIQGANIININCPEAAHFDINTIEEQFDYIIHTLALSNDAYCKDFTYANKVNVDFTRALLAFAAKQKQLKKFVHISTIMLYDSNNTTPVSETGILYFHHSTYGFTKGIAEQYAEHYQKKLGLPAVIFRLSNIYGPYQKFINSPFLIPSKIMQGLTEHKIEVFNLTPKRDWIYSEDAARAIIKAIDSSETGVFNLGTGKGTSVESLISEISKELGIPFSSLEKPVSGPNDFYCDIEKTRSAFSWEPTIDISEGIRKTIAWIKKEQERS